MHDIVVGVDGSTPSWRAFSLAVSIARKYGAQVRVCRVWRVPPAFEGLAFSVGAVPVFQGEEEGGYPELAKEVRAELELAGVEGDFCCREGDTAQQLEALAESCQADLIVVGRSRHPALHLGGVPRRLLAMGRRPVLVVP